MRSEFSFKNSKENDDYKTSFKSNKEIIIGKYNNNTNNINKNNLSKSQEIFEEQFDSTGMFHWVKERQFKNSILDETKRHSFRKHVIVCVFAEPVIISN